MFIKKKLSLEIYDDIRHRESYFWGLAIHFFFFFILTFSFIARSNEPNVFTKYSHEIKKIETFLNSMNSFQSEFDQVSPSGEISSGYIFLEKPGKMKLEYNSPNQIIILIKDKKVTYFDKELDEVTRSSLDSTILSFLTKQNLDLNQNLLIKNIKKNNNKVAVILEEKNSEDEGMLELVFDSKISILKAINLISIDGEVTEITIKNFVKDVVFAKNLFQLNRTFLNLN